MPFTVLDIPDSNAELAGWLERELVGLRLGDVVAGLLAFRPAVAPAPAIDTVLGDRRAALLQNGLSALSEPQLHVLLQHPRLLLPLQEQVLISGGPYWRGLELSPEHRQVVSDGLAAIHSVTSPTAARPASAGRSPSRRAQWLKVFAVAAVLLVGVFGWWQFQSGQAAPSGWGWDRPGALAAKARPDDYLNHLADGASDWFQQRPEDAASLRTRLEQFRDGCDTLLSAPHTPLAAADKDWLLERCSAWRGKIVEHIAALDQGAAPLEVRDAADATVIKLRTALRDRANTVGTSAALGESGRSSPTWTKLVARTPYRRSLSASSPR